MPFPELMASIDLIVHGTTVSTNAALTGNGAPHRRAHDRGLPRHAAPARRHARDAVRQPPTPPRPLAPRERTYGVTERIGPEGQVLGELDEASVRTAAAALREDGVEAVAISFLHSPQNPAHERRALEIVRGSSRTRT